MQIRTLFHLWRWKMEGGNTFSNFFHLLPTRDKIIFVHVFLRSENPSLGIRDTLKRWSSLLNTRLCIPRVSGSSPPSSTNTIMFIIVIFTCFRCWQESEATFWLNSNPVHRQTDAGRQLTVVLTAESRHERSAVSCELIFELKGRKAIRCKVL